jgi:hypothetical protein
MLSPFVSGYTSFTFISALSGASRMAIRRKFWVVAASKNSS